MVGGLSRSVSSSGLLQVAECGGNHWRPASERADARVVAKSTTLPPLSQQYKIFGTLRPPTESDSRALALTRVIQRRDNSARRRTLRTLRNTDSIAEIATIARYDSFTARQPRQSERKVVASALPQQEPEPVLTSRSAADTVNEERSIRGRFFDPPEPIRLNHDAVIERLRRQPTPHM